MNFTKTEILRNIRRETNFITKCKDEIEGLKFSIKASKKAKRMWENMLNKIND